MSPMLEHSLPLGFALFMAGCAHNPPPKPALSAFQINLPACKNQSPEACFHVGIIYGHAAVSSQTVPSSGR